MTFTHKFHSLSYGFIFTIFSQVLPASAAVHYVDASGNNPIPPYSDWATASKTIQDAIDISSSGDLIWVTNGVYASGGRPMDTALMNRVAIDKALTVQSVNGPAVTVIEGANGTNAPGLARGVWMTNNAVISGFTIRGGAATQTGVGNDYSAGGIAGYFGPGFSRSAVATNCIICTNLASSSGGGAARITLLNCTVSGNMAGSPTTPTIVGEGGGISDCNATNCIITGNSSLTGGGVSDSDLRNCAVTQNRASGTGGGTAGAVLVNCTVTGNVGGGTTSVTTGGTYGTWLVNCIVYGNTSSGDYSNSFSSVFTYSCTSPLAEGTGNIDADPQLLSDGIHLSSSSPCRGAGTFLEGPDTTDIDGQPWANPPSIGCDEYLAPAPVSISSGILIGTSFTLSFSGQPGTSYIVEQTSDLTPSAVWQTVASINATSTNLMQITDTEATNTSRLYRVRAQ
jgi:hypothetical protein